MFISIYLVNNYWVVFVVMLNLVIKCGMVMFSNVWFNIVRNKLSIKIINSGICFLMDLLFVFFILVVIIFFFFLNCCSKN